MWDRLDSRCHHHAFSCPPGPGRVADDNTDVEVELSFDSFIIAWEERRVPPVACFGCLECVGERDTLKRTVLTGNLGVSRLDIHGGDVVRQQHDFVGVQFGCILSK